MVQSNLGGEGLLGQSRISRQEPEGTLLTPGRLMLSYLSYVAQGHLPRAVIAHSGLGTPTQLQPRKYPTDIATGQSKGGNSSIQVPSLQLRLLLPECVKLTTKISNHVCII